VRWWHEIKPADAVSLDLSTDLSVEAPLNEAGERCPWPWEPQQLTGLPLGQYHCEYCDAMCVAGLPHPDYRDDGNDYQGKLAGDESSRYQAGNETDD
jgi:hypothetical protein